MHELTEGERFQRLLKNCSNELHDELTSTRHHISAEKPGSDLIFIFNLEWIYQEPSAPNILLKTVMTILKCIKIKLNSNKCSSENT